MKYALWTICMILVSLSVFSQDRDEKEQSDLSYKYTENPIDTLTVQSDSTHSTSRASLYSAVVPGLGQAYNGKHWKIPIIYTGFFVFGSLVWENNIKYQFFRLNLIAEIDEDPDTENITGRDAENLKANRDQFRRYRDLNMILIVVTYLLQIADANIDAHLIQFGFRKDVALYVDPTVQPTNYSTQLTTGLSLKLRF